MPRALALLLLLLLASCNRRPDVYVAVNVTSKPAKLSYNRDIRPILSDHCFRCHGPDSAARKRGLRLDTLEGSRARLFRGSAHIIVPGKPQESELIRRLDPENPDDIMPPAEMHLELTPEQKNLIKLWIEQDAEYEPHWAFSPVKDVPDFSIDAVVAARLKKENIKPSPRADPAILMRRVSLALTGLPPSVEELTIFLRDPSPPVYLRYVEHLLASPRFGERMAADWLDVARFADTYGYQSDWECRVWPWRDWLINSFNSNQHYSEFIREQLAGDLLPNSTPEQKLATTFNRLHRQTNEGGSIDEEFRREYISDRIHTFGTAFLGLTLECARCHDHKYDPILQKDYYSLGSFFGGIDEAGTYPYSTSAVPRPAMRLPTAAHEAELKKLQDTLAEVESTYADTIESHRDAYRNWLDRKSKVEIAPPVKRFAIEGNLTGPALSSGETLKATHLDGDTGPSFKDVPPFTRSDPHSLVFWMNCPDEKSRATIIHTSTFTIESDEQGYQVMLKDGRLCWEIIHLFPGSAAAIRTTDPFPLNRWVQVAVTYDGSSRASGLHIYLDGQPAKTEIVRDHLDGPATVRSFQVGYRDRDQGFKGGGIADIQVFDRKLTLPEICKLHEPFASGCFFPIDFLFDYYTTNINPDCISAAKALQNARSTYNKALEAIPEIMVMEQTAHPRNYFVLTRGQYDQPDLNRPVSSDRAVDAIFPFDTTLPHNRLGLAAWTTDPANPLTARVAVNRLWAICFGRGLVPTLENFGLQSEPPEYPELLDGLASTFINVNWDTKVLLRAIVLSDTFCQSSDFTPQLLARDPANNLLARGPSYRLSAETLRDQALFASGLLSETIGGPSVKPWQPPGLWADAGVSSQGDYKPDTGENSHRRSLYTFRKRTAPPPNMLAFDAGSREQCLARRQPTNTPLQPLVILNDPVFFECAKALAIRATTMAKEPKMQIEAAFRLVACRDPRDPEIAALLDLYNAQHAEPADPAKPQADPLTLVCSTILASDAAVTSR